MPRARQHEPGKAADPSRHAGLDKTLIRSPAPKVLRGCLREWIAGRSAGDGGNRALPETCVFWARLDLLDCKSRRARQERQNDQEPSVCLRRLKIRHWMAFACKISRHQLKRPPIHSGERIDVRSSTTPTDGSTPRRRSAVLKSAAAAIFTARPSPLVAPTPHKETFSQNTLPGSTSTPDLMLRSFC